MEISRTGFEENLCKGLWDKLKSLLLTTAKLSYEQV
jgi:hypothetical protein